MNAFNSEKPRQTIGRLFQKITTERFQQFDCNINSSKDNKDYQWICDIYDQASNSLIELKSHKIIDPHETTLDTFEKILKQDEVRRKNNQNNSGLFYQLTEMSKKSESFAVMVGCYNEDVNKLKNQLISNDPKGYASFTEYRFLIVLPNSVYWCSVPQSNFWRHIKASWEINNGQIKSFLRNTLASFDFLRSYEITDQTGYERSLIDFVKQLKFGLTEDQIELAFDGKPYHNYVTDTQQLEIKLDKTIQTWIEKEKQAQESIEAEQNETTQEQAQIEPIEKITKDQVVLFKPDQLELIEKAVADHESFSAISVKVGHSSNYIAQIISQPKGTYTREEYELFRNWFIDICLESNHWETPSDRCNLDQLKLITDTLRIKLRGHKAQNTGLRNSKADLERQVQELTESRVRQRNIINGLELKIKKHEEEIKEMANAETQEDKGLSQLEKEAYEAEIEKLNDFIQGHKARVENFKISNEELKGIIERSEARALETEAVKLQDEIEELQEELEEQKSETESLRNNIHSAYQKDLERYRKIIDMLLDQLDKQENE